MSGLFDRLAQANQLRYVVESVNCTRRELTEKQRPDTVDVAIEFHLAQESDDSETWGPAAVAEVVPTLVHLPRSVGVSIPAGYAPGLVRKALMYVADNYEKRHDEFTRSAEIVATRVLGESDYVGDTDYDDLPF